MRNIHMVTILVVDDHADDRQLLVTLIGYYGHRVLQATDGSEALQIARAKHPDLIISDILMPTMDGYEFVRRLRVDPDIAQTAVVFYTANYLEREAVAMAQACGVSQILSKPCEPAEVIRTVEGVLHLTTPPTATDPTHGADGDEAQEPTKPLSRGITELEVDKLRLLALIEFRHRLFTERHPQRLLDGFCHAARELIGAKLAAVGVLGDDGQSWRYSFISGLRPEDMAQVTLPPPHQGLLSHWLEARQPLRLRAPDPDLQAVNFLPWVPNSIHAFLGVPVFSPHRTYGWIGLIGKLGVDGFTEADELLAMTLATEVATAYENATLHESLQCYAAELEQEVNERQRAEAAVRESAKHLAGLSRRLLEVQEDERRHLARELHDEIGQLLTGLKLSLEACLRLPAEAIHARLGQAQHLVSELISQVRDMSLDLRPAILDDFGLLPALLWQIERYMSQTGVRVTLEHAGLDRRYAPELETAAYPIVQEALTNVARHATVDEAVVRLDMQGERLIVQMADQGTSFDPQVALTTGRTGGLAGMRERTHLLGGRLVVESRPGVGTLVRAELPLYPSASRLAMLPTYDQQLSKESQA
jgi:signal transduction histidine kinase/DNA-binding response OmpR family regulator